MANLEIVKLSDKTAYLPSPTNVGLIETGAGTVIVDSGNDAEAGRKILKVLATTSRQPVAVLLTHSNADHLGGAAFIASRTGAPVYASRLEAAFSADPVLEPSFLWGGLPPKELRGKFFMAPACSAAVIAEGPLSGAQAGIEAISLPGHYFGQLGFLADGVLFAGDALFGAQSIAKHPLFFIYDPAAFLASLDRIVAAAPRLVVPSHGAPTDDIAGLAAANRAGAENMAAAVLDACAVPASAEDVLSRLCLRFNIDLGWSQYALVGSTVKSFLVYLRERGELSAEFSGGRLWWRKT